MFLRTSGSTSLASTMFSYSTLAIGKQLISFSLYVLFTTLWRNYSRVFESGFLGSRWGYDKFPKETPLVFYREGKPIDPPLDILQGFEVVLQHMVSYIQREVPAKTLKFWRLQSPRHFYGGDWNQNGSCLLDKPLDENQVYALLRKPLFPLDLSPCFFFSGLMLMLRPRQLDLWFDPRNNGLNKEARRINRIIRKELQTTEIKLLDVTHLSEFRADAHPAIWLGKQDAVAIWGQDCMHWCLPGVPDTWVDILAQLILTNSKTEWRHCQESRTEALLGHGKSKCVWKWFILTVNDEILVGFLCYCSKVHTFTSTQNI